MRGKESRGRHAKRSMLWRTEKFETGWKNIALHQRESTHRRRIKCGKPISTSSESQGEELQKLRPISCFLKKKWEGGEIYKGKKTKEESCDLSGWGPKKSGEEAATAIARGGRGVAEDS